MLLPVSSSNKSVCTKGMNYTYIRAITSQVVVTAPGQVGAVIVNTDDDDDIGSVILYDGESASDPRILRIRTLEGETKVVRFQPPLNLHNGLYLELGEKTPEVLVQIQWEDE